MKYEEILIGAILKARESEKYVDIKEVKEYKGLSKMRYIEILEYAERDKPFMAGYSPLEMQTGTAKHSGEVKIIQFPKGLLYYSFLYHFEAYSSSKIFVYELIMEDE